MADASLVNTISTVYAFTALGVGVILAAAGLGSALGWGLICAKYMEGIARQPEMLPALRVQMFITAGLMTLEQSIGVILGNDVGRQRSSGINGAPASSRRNPRRDRNSSRTR